MSEQADVVDGEWPHVGRREPRDVAQVILRLPADAKMIGSARRFVAEQVRELGGRQVVDAELLASEAVTNSVVHAHTAMVELSVGIVGGAVHIGVHDDDPTLPEVSTAGSPIGGHGMNLIRALSSEWGVTDILGDGKRVWFEMEL